MAGEIVRKVTGATWAHVGFRVKSLARYIAHNINCRHGRHTTLSTTGNPALKLDAQLCFALYSTLLGVNKVYRTCCASWISPTRNTW